MEKNMTAHYQGSCYKHINKSERDVSDVPVPKTPQHSTLGDKGIREEMLLL